MLQRGARFSLAYRAAAEDLRKNPGQWQAYESTGNCVVLAGPGSGKTKTLTIKLARMLAEDVEPPRGIACITYNSECAAVLGRRLDKLGIQESSKVFIGTIHSFCLKHVVVPYGRLAAGVTNTAGIGFVWPCWTVWAAATPTNQTIQINVFGWSTLSPSFARQLGAVLL
jgi:superfamily I DNA/RNA helicase